MTTRQARLHRRATKAGIVAAKRREHSLSPEEIRRLKVQIVPAWIRIIMGISGLLLIGISLLGSWIESTTIQVISAVVGTLITLFGIFGVKRILSGIIDQLAPELALEVFDKVAESISDAVDF